MKLSPTAKQPQNIITQTIKKFRTVRQSQPNFISHDILNDVEKIKDSHKNRLRKNQRQPRLSQADAPNIHSFLSPDFKIEENKKSQKSTFFSPPSILQHKMMKKSQNTVYYQTQISSPKNYLAKISSTLQMKNRKSPIKNHKESLHLIQEMLFNHGIKLNSKTQKKQKSPRFSEPLLQENDGLCFGKKKQNQSLGNTKKQIPEKGDLKETMSTLASYKNMKVLKITDFELGKDLGKGKFGRVKVAKHKKTGMLFSLKIIKKTQIKEENIINQLIKQIKIQSFINHSHIVKLYSVFDDKQNVYLLLELCTQGNLYHLMQRKIKIPEDQAGSILRQVCEGVNELHQLDIIHRDIKPENIVLCYGMAKICDFGWSTQVKENMRQTFCGTPLYVSPQLLSGNLYDEKIDMWSIGILGYEMMTGSIPFRIKSEKDLMKIVQKQIVFPKWMSEKAVLFLKDLLEKDPTKRKQISEILCNQFLNKPKKK